MNTTTWRRMALAAAVALLLGFTPRHAIAEDVIVLKDGTTITGTIVREDSGFVWIKQKVGSIETERFFGPDEIASITRDGAKPADKPKNPQNNAATNARNPARPALGVERVAIISLGDPANNMVGTYMSAQPMEEIVPLLESEGVTTVVFLITSGGGAGFEIQRMVDVIEQQYKPRFRVVAWIKEAISAAAMTAHCIEELYFFPDGRYGACTGFYGASLITIEGRVLEEMLHRMVKISGHGHRDPAIMRSMQVEDPLSCTVKPDGTVEWFQSEDGQILVNPKGKILTFTSDLAARTKFSKGTAATKEELAKLMGLGEVEWVGSERPGVPYPVSLGEARMRAFREQLKRDEDSLQSYFLTYQTSVEMARSAQDKQERGRFVGVARRSLDRIEAMIRNLKNQALFIGFNSPEEFFEWLEEQRKLLRDLMR